MLISLEADRFRNLEPLQIELGAGRHLFLGPNGAGKTSLLEAVYLLATTRSFRTHRLSECARQGEDTFRLVGETSERRRLEAFLVDGQRERRVNGERTSLAEHLASLPVISWTVADGEVLTGPPEERRRFLDRGIIGLRSTALDAVSRYRHALDGKKELLRSGQARRDPVQLGVWNELQAAAAAELAALRAAYVARLSAALDRVLEEAGIGLPAVRLAYRPSPKESIDGVDAVRWVLEAAAEKETALEQPLLGPQRDDLSIRWRGDSQDADDTASRPVKRIASAGERKALGLSLLVAHGRVLASEGVEPVVVLDDVDVELDPERLRRLWRILKGRQVLVTSARPAVWDDLEVDVRWRVESGRIERAC